MVDYVLVPRDPRNAFYFPIPMPLDKDNRGPASIGEIAKITYEVWDQEFTSHGSFEYLPDAIAKANELNNAIPETADAAVRIVTKEMLEALTRIRNTAMKYTLVARIPECGEFGAIAQDADWLLSEITAVMEAAHDDA